MWGSCNMVWSLIAEIIIALLSIGSDDIFARFQSFEQIVTYYIISYIIFRNSESPPFLQRNH